MEKTNVNLPEIIYQLSKKSSGKSEKLMKFFKLDPAHCQEVYPLTRLQHDIYLDICVNPDTKAYNIGDYVVHEGPFDINVWRDAVNIYANKHAIFRTSLVASNSIVYQYVRKSLTINLEVHDLSGHELGSPEVDTFVRTLLDRPYRIFEDPLQKHIVIKLSGSRHLICIATHQLGLDGIGGKLYFEQISAIYQGLVQGAYAENAAPAHTFRDYVFINNETFDSHEGVRFWKKLLHGASLPLRTRFASHEKQVSRAIELGPGDFEKIKAFCWAHKITPSFYLKILYALLLRETLAITDANFLIFENRHGRSKEFLEVPGVFLYSEPLLVAHEAFGGQVNFFEILNHFRQYREMIKKTDNVSFGTILGMLTGKTGIRFFFNYLKYANIDFLDQKVCIHPFESAAPNEVHFFVEEKVNSFLITLFYNEGHYDFNSFLDRLSSVSRQVLDNGQAPLAGLDIVLPFEKRLMQNEFVGKPVKVDKTFCDLFEAQVKATPDALSVKFEGRSWSYETLNKKANQLAHHLIDLGIGKEHVVAVLASRSDMFLISMLSILKAHAAYLPIDPAYPPRRREYMMADACPNLVLLESDLVPDMPDMNCPLFILDRELDGLNTPVENLEAKPKLEDLAYVIYTSGSTGRPKGSMVEHASLANHLLAKVDEFCITPGSVVAQIAPPGFDISIWQFLAPLTAGGSVVIYPDQVIHEPQRLVNSVGHDGIQLIEFVPSYLDILLGCINDQNRKDLSTLRCVIATGEELKEQLVKKWFEACPGIRLANAYGPSEAADDVTHFIMDGFQEQRPVPVGYPIQNTRIHIIDASGRLCPPGLKGELWVSGIAVGRGYLNNPELTVDVFGQDHFTDGVTKLYKTGDSAARMPDGAVVFYGRTDQQVKVNGHRVELSEIENLALMHRGVAACVALVVKDDRGNNRLALFYIADGALSLKEHLRAFLPAAVVPSFFVQLERFPLNANGKIDRASLLNYRLSPAEEAVEAAATETEKQLLGIWQQALGKSGIGITQDFFDIGGHSLAAMQITQLILEQMEVKLPLKALFEHTNIKALAREIEAVQRLQNTAIVEGLKEREEFII